MCYKKPGPRCTYHAKKVLISARKRWDEAKTDFQRDIAWAALKEAEKQFYATPGGLAYLKAKIDAGEDENGIYEAQFNRSSHERKSRLAIIKSKDRGDIEEQHVTEDEPGEAVEIITLNKDPNKDPGMYIDSIASLDEFHEALGAGLVSARPHSDPNVPYVVFDYSDQVQYTRAWNPVTMASRGLIVNKETGEIVARPFGKFFNDTEDVPGYNDFSRTGPVVVTDKADGSMGILYNTPDGEPAFSTRGSMNSEQARHATELYKKKYAGTWEPNPSRTYLYEVIYPTNRVVLDYGDKDDVVLIGAVDKASGKSIPLNEITEWKGDRVEQLPYASYTQALQAPVPPDREGYVVHFTDSDKRVKLKGARYLELHKVMTGVTPNRIWEKVSAGETTEEWRHSVPEEFANTVFSYEKKLRGQFAVKMKEIDDSADKVRAKFKDAGSATQTPESRREMAEYVKANFDRRMSGLVFSRLRGSDKGISSTLWRELRPGGSATL